MRHEVGWHLSPLAHGTRTTGWRGVSPLSAAVATLCPFLLPPIRRHRSVIRNCVSLSSPYSIRLYGTCERSYAFLRISFPSSPSRPPSSPLRRSTAPSATIIVRLFPFRHSAISRRRPSSPPPRFFFSFSSLARRDNSRVNQR